MATKKLTDKQAAFLLRITNNVVTYASEKLDGRVIGSLKRGYPQRVIVRSTAYGMQYIITEEGQRMLNEYLNSEPAAIAANVSADAASAWTPKPGDRVRIKATGKIGRVRAYREGTRTAIMFYSVWNNSSDVLMGAFTADELEPAPDAAQTAAFAVGDRVEVPCFNGNYPPDDPIRFGRIEWIEGGSAGVRSEAYGLTVEQFEIDDLKLVERAAPDPRDEQITALERELEAVKQMFDGYQTAARETEQALTRDLEVARTEAAALRTTTTALETERDLLRELILDITERVNSYSPMEGLTKVYELKNRAASIVRVNVVQLTTSELFPADAALAAARQRADSDPATWLTAADVRVQSEFAEED